MILLSIAKKWEPFSVPFLVVMAVVTIVVTGVDYVFPAIGAKKYGSSRAGLWGAIVGMIIGAFLGAVLGETLSGKTSQDALKAGWGVFFRYYDGYAFQTYRLWYHDLLFCQSLL